MATPVATSPAMLVQPPTPTWRPCAPAQMSACATGAIAIGASAIAVGINSVAASFFIAGLDLTELGDSTDLPDMSPQWPPMTKPVIGAINGAAVTGGLELALYYDVLIASEQARFAGTHALR